MASRRVSTGLAVGCLAALAAGCSSSGSSSAATSVSTSPKPDPMSAAAYRSALHQVAQEENTAQRQVQQAFTAHTVARLRAAFATFAADQRHASAQLAALAPPANAVTANAQLAHAFSDNAAAIGHLLTTLAPAKTVKQALAIVQNDRAGQQSGQEIDTALGALKKLGYTSGS